MELKAILNKKDTDQVEIWSSDSQREYLAGTMHIDNFTGPVRERINDGHSHQLHVEIVQPKAYEVLAALSDNGFDELDVARQGDVMDDINRMFSDLASVGWNYDDNMAGGVSS